MEPVLQQQGEAQHTALGDAGQGMDVVEAEGEDGASQECHGTVFRLQLGKQNNTTFLFYSTRLF